MFKVIRFIFIFSTLFIFIGNQLPVTLIRDKMVITQNEKGDVEHNDMNDNHKDKEEKKDDKDKLYAYTLPFTLEIYPLQFPSHLTAVFFENRCLDLESPPPKV